MQRVALAWLLSLALWVVSGGPVSAGEELKVAEDAEFNQILAEQQGKKVILRMIDGGELAGLVRRVTPHVVHLGELVGKEYYDAVVSVDHISAVIVRTRQ